MKNHLFTVLTYFGYFSYTPSFDEIYTFFPHKIGKEALQSCIDKEVAAKTIRRILINKEFRLFKQSLLNLNFEPEFPRYTLPQYSIKTNKILNIKNQNVNKWRKKTIQRYIEILQAFPFVRFVGVTGTSAMRRLQENDDLDLCIVTKHGLVWTARFFTVIVAKMLGIHTYTGVCLNLFFDEADLIIPRKKHNSYIAHELLQMKPIIDKDGIYQRFLEENKWIYTFFPNAPYVIPTHSNSVQAPVGIQKRKLYRSRIKFGMTQGIDRLFKLIQLPIIYRNRAAFYITPTQLWLFKNDFEKKLKRSGLVI